MALGGWKNSWLDEPVIDYKYRPTRLEYDGRIPSSYGYDYQRDGYRWTDGMIRPWPQGSAYKFPDGSVGHPDGRFEYYGNYTYAAPQSVTSIKSFTATGAITFGDSGSATSWLDRRINEVRNKGKL